MHAASRKGNWLIGAALLLAVLLGSMLIGSPVIAAANSTSLTVADGVYGGTTTAVISPAPSTAKATTTNNSVWIDAFCYQGGTLVFWQRVLADSNGSATLTLGPTSMWVGGAAACTADALAMTTKGRWRTVASTTFVAAAN